MEELSEKLDYKETLQMQPTCPSTFIITVVYSKSGNKKTATFCVNKTAAYGFEGTNKSTRNRFRRWNAP